MGALTCRLRRSERGSELIELALVTPVLLMILVAVIDFGFLFMRYQVITNAAREGARIGILPGYLTGDITTRVGDYVKAGGLSKPATTTVTTVSLSSGVRGIKVLVEYPHTFTFLGPLGKLFGASFGTVTLKSAATMKVEL